MSELFKNWNDYLSRTFGSFSIEIVNHCIMNSRFKETSPFSLKLRPNDPNLALETIAEIQNHCDKLGLTCTLLSQEDKKYTSGSCLPFHQLNFTITGYPSNLHEYHWRRIEK